MSIPLVSVIGEMPRTSFLAPALRRSGLTVAPVLLEEARRTPGSWLGAGLVVCTWPAGGQPEIENELFTQATGALHASWDTLSAEVGPFVAPGLGPCPGCLAVSSPSPGEGCSAALGAWVATTITLHALGILDERRSDLVGASWLWRRTEPGLQLIERRSRPGCPVPGCV